MGIRTIVQIGHPTLRHPAEPVTEDVLASASFQALIDDLVATMRDANGAGLAAPQIDEPVRLCAIEVGDNPRYPYKPKIPLTILVNPVLTALTDETYPSYEGCLSVPNLRGLVHRSTKLRVEALDRHGAPMKLEVSGLAAGTYQHEVDHLDATLFVDRVTDPHTLTTWAEFDRRHKQPWLDSIQYLIGASR